MTLYVNGRPKDYQVRHRQPQGQVARPRTTTAEYIIRPAVIQQPVVVEHEKTNNAKWWQLGLAAVVGGVIGYLLGHKSNKAEEPQGPTTPVTPTTPTTPTEPTTPTTPTPPTPSVAPSYNQSLSTASFNDEGKQGVLGDEKGEVSTTGNDPTKPDTITVQDNQNGQVNTYTYSIVMKDGQPVTNYDGSIQYELQSAIDADGNSIQANHKEVYNVKISGDAENGYKYEGTQKGIGAENGEGKSCISGAGLDNAKKAKTKGDQHIREIKDGLAAGTAAKDVASKYLQGLPHIAPGGIDMDKLAKAIQDANPGAFDASGNLTKDVTQLTFPSDLAIIKNCKAETEGS